MLVRKNIGSFAVMVALVTAVLWSPIEAQTKRRKAVATKKPVVTSIAPAPEPAPEDPVVKSAPKKNERPASDSAAVERGTNAQVTTASEPTYFYEFAQPEFTISKMVIEHDDAGKGKITFTRKLFSETVSDPLQVSPAALERINAAYASLNFVESNESYQYEKDYSHLGVATFRLKKSGKQRTAVFNYTVNKDAKALADEYRKLGNQFVWIFDITVARENQPLESPKLLDALDWQMRRNEISDPTQLLPLLRSLSDDERVPLISRNHAAKLVEKIEKSGKK